jgi:hypothetical protein
MVSAKSERFGSPFALHRWYEQEQGLAFLHSFRIKPFFELQKSIRKRAEVARKFRPDQFPGQAIFLRAPNPVSQCVAPTLNLDVQSSMYVREFARIPKFFAQFVHARGKLI